MTTERIEIVVSKTGDKEASKGLQDIGGSAEAAQKPVDGLNSSLGFLKTTLAALGIAGVVAEYVRLTDTFTGIVNRLKLVSTSGQDLVNTEKALFDSANRTRSSFEETANLYTKLAQNAGSLGIEQKSLIPNIETINQLIAISGASATEASAGLLQFSQGLASNRFQGDELRSVLENLPALGQAIAKGLGTTTAGLRKMGEEGQLSAKLVLDALNKQAPEIAKQFATITPTVGSAIQVMKNQLLQFVGVFDQASGVSGKVAQAILFVANNFITFTKILGLATAAVVAFYTAMAVQAGWTAFSAGIAAVTARIAAANVVLGYAGLQLSLYQKALILIQGPLAAVRAAFVALWAVIAANPFTIIITVIGAAVAALYLFGDAVKLTSDGSITAWGAVVGIVTTMWDLLKQLASWVGTVLGPIFTVIGQTIVAVFTAIFNAVKAVVDLVAMFIPSLQGASLSLGSFGETLIKNMKDASNVTKEAGLEAKNFGDTFKSAGDQVAASADGIGKSVKFAADGMTQLGRVTADAIPPFENLVRAQERANRVIAEGKRRFDENRAAVDANREALKQLEFTTRDAMGNIIKYSGAADAQTGRLFSNIQSGAAAAESSLESLAGSFGDVASAAASSGGGGGGGSSSADATITTFYYADQASVRQSSKTMGGSQEQADAVIRAINDVEFFYGTGLGPGAIDRLYKTLASLKPEVAKTWTQAYPFLNTYMAGQGLPTFRRGGSFDVGGNGGPDSQLVQFMASPNESVTVETPAQRRRRLSSNGGASGQNKTVVVNMNVQTPDANSFNRSKNQTYLALKSKLAGV